MQKKTRSNLTFHKFRIRTVKVHIPVSPKVSITSPEDLPRFVVVKNNVVIILHDKLYGIWVSVGVACPNSRVSGIKYKVPIILQGKPYTSWILNFIGKFQLVLL